ncbi:MAG TPA: hypothetical protein VGS78_02185 [Candidatus Sulfotelmatobacter sp.]|nr:hypothetical protein [Candidatus Sulfotelmatobacter sp.]
MTKMFTNHCHPGQATESAQPIQPRVEGPFVLNLRILPLLVVAALTLLPTLSRAADQATITFTLDFPNSSPSHYSIQVQADGRAHYESIARISPDSTDTDNYQTDFTFSDATRARIFELAQQAHYFSGKVDSGKKKLAFTGAKKLIYKDADHNSTAEYNYSPIPAVGQLTALFQSVGATLEYGRRLTYFHHYQKLALDDELKNMEDEARTGEITELQAVKPILREIYDDPSVMNVVRGRAYRLMEMNPSISAGK